MVLHSCWVADMTRKRACSVGWLGAPESGCRQGNSSWYSYDMDLAPPAGSYLLPHSLDLLMILVSMAVKKVRKCSWNYVMEEKEMDLVKQSPACVF